MLDPIPPTSVLRAFEAAVRFKNFSKAADHLGVSQSAISHAIKDLEIIVGKKLFTRNARRTAPTADAILLCEAVRNGFKQIHEAVQECRATQNANELVVSCFPGFAVKWLFPKLINFDTEHPGIAVSLKTLVGARKVAEDEADIAIDYVSKGSVVYSAEMLAEEHLIPVCSPEYLQNNGPLETPGDLHRHALLCDEVNAPEGVQTLWTHWLESVGVPSSILATRRTFGQSNMVIQAAVEGRGVALGRTMLIAEDLQQKRLVAPFGPAVPSPYGYYLVAAGGDRKAENVAAFKSWIAKEANKTVTEHNRFLEKVLELQPA